MFRVNLGSKSKLKINAVIAAFAELHQYMDLNAFEVDSGISKQPRGFAQILKGARERAKASLTFISIESRADFLGVGIENGIVKIGAHYFDPAVAVIVDSENNEWVGFGPGMPIPDWAVLEARTSELGDVVMRRGAKDKNPHAYFSNGDIDRVNVLSWAVKCALTPLLNGERYRK